MNEWIERFQIKEPGYIVFDAAGMELEHVIQAREVEDGIEVVCAALTPEGEEIVGSNDGGVHFEPIQARMVIPGGEIYQIN